MKLYYSITSPFARKVRIAAQLLGLDQKIELVLADVYSEKSNDFKSINPLIKIPALEIDKDHILTNSPFIVDYINQLGQGNLIPRTGRERWVTLNLQSQCDGLVEAAVLRLYESRRKPELFDPSFDQRQKNKIQNVLEYLNQNLNLFQSANHSDRWSVAEVSLICALDYLDFRFSHEQFLKPYPALSQWQSQARLQSCVLMTKPQ